MTDPAGSWESTLSLLTRARSGDERALNDLFARYSPGLRRWASGRLPRWARDLSDTPDIVQETLLQTFRNIGSFEYRGEGALQAYLRQAVMNRIRQELRRVQRRPEAVGLDEELLDDGPSPLEAAVGSETLRAYECALEGLSDEERALVVARVELGLTYSEIAATCGKVSPDAARMAVGRALVRLAEIMGEPSTPTD